MRFLYSTDLHGNEKKYEIVKQYAIRNGIKLIHLGADIFPKEKNLHEIQKRFAVGYLSNFIEDLHKEGIQIVCLLGNDDLHNSSKHIKRKDNFHLLHDLNTSCPKKIYEFDFDGIPFVPDHPWSLKTASRIDYIGWKRPKSISETKLEKIAKEERDLYRFVCPLAQYESFENGKIEAIYNIDNYLKNHKTLEEELKTISTNEIIALHSPPSKCLDTTLMKKNVGSDAIRRWIKKNQPRLVLCGHIHENYKMTNKWKHKIGKTLVIQPGQGVDETYMVDIEINETDVYPTFYIQKE